MKRPQYSFRLSHGDPASLAFTASQDSFRSNLHRAFISLVATHRAPSASLEVHHKVHSWQQVYNNRGVCQRISNPLMLDHQQLFEAAIYTLRCCDSWPTEEERQVRKEQLRKKERHEQSLALRETFYVVQVD